MTSLTLSKCFRKIGNTKMRNDKAGYTCMRPQRRRSLPLGALSSAACGLMTEMRLLVRTSTTTAPVLPTQAATPANELGQKIQHRVSKGGRTLRLNIQVKDCHGRVREGYLRAAENLNNYLRSSHPGCCGWMTHCESLPG